MSPRRIHKVDANQPRIVAELRDILGKHAVVSIAHAAGGVGDILVAYGGQTWMLEIKDGDKPPSARKLTPAEARFHRDWTRAGGQIDVVLTTEQVLDVIGFNRWRGGVPS